MQKFTVKENDSGQTILKFIEKMFRQVPKSHIEKLFRKKEIRLNGKTVKNKKIILCLNDEIVIYQLKDIFLPKIYNNEIEKPQIVYEDENILVVNKKPGITTNNHPHSLDEQVWRYLNFKQKDSFVPSSVGRLDKVASGIVVYGKNYQTLRMLKQMQKNFIKIYCFKSDLNKNIASEVNLIYDSNIRKTIVSEQGKKSKTFFYLENNRQWAQIETGLKHQIRASIAYFGFPIHGDLKYGGIKKSRVYLHAYSVKFMNLVAHLEYLNYKIISCEPNW